LDGSHPLIPHLDSKTRGFPPHPHGWFDFVGNYLLKLRNGCQQKSIFVLMGKTERGNLKKMFRIQKSMILLRIYIRRFFLI